MKWNIGDFVKDGNGDAFDSLQDACFYDFGKDMEDCSST